MRTMFSALCGFAALAAIEAARADTEIVHFPATMPDGATVTLNARIVRPADDKPVPAVVLLHGCDGSIDGTDLYSDWVLRVFGGWPYLFLIVDSLGSRGMSRDLDHGCGPAGPNSQMRAIDAQAARSWLAAQTFVDPRRIAVIGWSAGGTAALAAIANGCVQRAGWTGVLRRCRGVLPDVPALPERLECTPAPSCGRRGPCESLGAVPRHET
jgi:poly(3-hydroxybutyrate) depolymerase